MTTTSRRILKLPQVLELVPVSRATWYAGVKDGRYPAPIKLGPRAVAWLLADIENFIVSLDQNHKELY